MKEYLRSRQKGNESMEYKPQEINITFPLFKSFISLNWQLQHLSINATFGISHMALAFTMTKHKHKLNCITHVSCLIVSWYCCVYYVFEWWALNWNWRFRFGIEFGIRIRLMFRILFLFKTEKIRNQQNPKIDWL